MTLAPIPGRHSRRAWRGVALLASAAVGYPMLPSTGPARPLFLAAAGAAAAAALGLRGRRAPPGHRRPWLLLACGLTTAAVADGIAAVATLPLVGPAGPLAHLRDLTSLFAALAVTLGVAGITRARTGPDLPAALDTAVLSTSLALAGWVLTVAPAMDDVALSGVSRVVTAIPPLIPFVLLVLVLRLGASDVGLAAAGRWLLAALVLLVAAMLGSAASAAAGRPELASALGALWLLACGSFAAAAVSPSAAAVTERQPVPIVDRIHRRTATLGFGSLLVPVALVVVADSTADRAVAGTLAVVLALVTVRTRWTMQELERTRAQDVEHQRRRDDRRLEALVRHAADVVLVIDARGDVVYASPSAAGLLGEDPTGWDQDRLAARLHDDERSATAGALRDRLSAAAGRPVRLRARLQDRGEREHHVDLVALDLRDDPDVEGVVLTLHETTERAELERRLRHLAFHDTLTGLANRDAFLDRLTQALTRTTRTGGRLAVLLCDLDDFKDVNDTLGHPAGDELLRVFASRLGNACRATDLVARLGGDEFAVLSEDIHSTADAVATAQRLLETATRPITIDGHELRVGCSIGIAVDGGERSSEELLRDADVALYEAKGSGKQRWALHRTSMTVRTLARLRLASDLARAIEDDDIGVAFQPIVDLRTRVPVGFEALARWTHPDRGRVPPAEFVALAESTGLVVDLGARVLARSLAELARTDALRPGLPPLRLGVNVSARQLHEPDLPEQVAALLAAADVSAERLVLELTETAMLDDTDQAARIMQRLRDVGVRFAVDDFGTGYSSLAYLRRLPVDIVKIDRSFVQELLVDDDATELVQAIIDLTRNLRLDVVAEGVETEEQRATLHAMGCTFGQGYLFARPVAHDALETWLAAHSTTPPDTATPVAVSPVG